MNGRKQHPCKTIARSAILLSIAVAAALAVAALLCFSAVSDDNSDGAVGDTFVVDGIQYWIKSENPKEVSVHKCIGTQVTVTIPSMVKGYNVTSIDKAAFTNCAEIETVNISEGVKTIEELGFSYCYSLKNVKLPSTLETIGTKAFKNCVSINTMKIPDTVKSIRSNAFESCIMLESVNIPSAVTEISKEVFFNCSSLKEITIPDSITSIGVNAFAKCSALKFILIPDSVRKIDDCAFAECTDLELVEIGSGVASVGYNMGAFSGCLKIAYISLNCSTISKMTFDEYALKYTDDKIDRGKYVATGRLESGKIEMKYYDYDTNHCVVAYSDEKMVHGPEMVNEVIAPQIPARIGGTFKGWAIAGDSTGQLYDPGEVVDVAPGKDVIFVAVWIDPTPPPTPTPTPTPTPVPVPVPTPVPTPVPVMDNTAIPVALVMLAIIALLSIMVVLMARRK